MPLQQRLVTISILATAIMYAPDCNAHVKMIRLIFNRVIIAGIGRTVGYFAIDHNPMSFSCQYHVFTSMPKTVSKSSLLY